MAMKGKLKEMNKHKEKMKSCISARSAEKNFLAEIETGI